MDNFEYLPQLIVAYDGDDEFANLIHVQKANKDNNYLCPCCGGIVKPRALDSTKEQSHYYHVTGKCTKESQLHFFCKNWLFEKGSQFYIEDDLFTVQSIEVEKQYNTDFGKYIPDVTVHTTSGKDIYFEMFFSNRKTGDDYFCKWSNLGNDVVEVNIKEYMIKTDASVIPRFKYLYHDGICYSESYVKRDMYADTIAKMKCKLTRQEVLNYKIRIAQLDWFWQKIIENESKEDILKAVSKMQYDDMVLCYSIIKRKRCVSYLKDEVKNIINQKAISEAREKINLPYDENVYFDLEHIQGRTYKTGVRINLKTDHITYSELFNFSESCFPKIVFKKNLLNIDEFTFLEDDDVNKFKKMRKVFDKCMDIKNQMLEYENELADLESDSYKIKMNNDLYTVLLLSDCKNEILFQDKHICIGIQNLSQAIQDELYKRECEEFLQYLFSSDEYHTFVSDCKSYEGINVNINIKFVDSKKHMDFIVYVCGKCVIFETLNPTIDDFLSKSEECKVSILEFINKYSMVLTYVKKINSSSNKLWKSSFFVDRFEDVEIRVDQTVFTPHKHMTFSKAYISYKLVSDEEYIIESLKDSLKEVMKNMERCGYRLLEVH